MCFTHLIFPSPFKLVIITVILCRDAYVNFFAGALNTAGRVFNVGGKADHGHSQEFRVN